MKLTLTCLLMILGFANLTAQNCKAIVRYVDERTLEGNAVYYFQANTDSVHFWLPANGYANKNSLLADTLFKAYNPCLYFATKNDMGGYTAMDWSSEEGAIVSQFNESKEHFRTKLPDSKTLAFSFTLKLPKRCGELGYDPNYMFLKNWLPIPNGSESWTYLILLDVPSDRSVLCSDQVEEKKNGVAHHYSIVAFGHQPDVSITSQKLAASTEKDIKGNLYQLYRKEGTKPISYRKKSRYMRAVSYNFKDSLATKRLVIDDGRYSKMRNMLFLSRKAIMPSEKSFYPTYRYTDKGNHMVGFLLHNTTKGRQPFYYFLNPYFSFKNDFNWSLGIMKPFKVKNSWVSQISPQITYRKYHYFTNDIDDYNLSYHRISPRVKLNLKKHRWINVEYAYIAEQLAYYEGRDIRFDYQNSHLYRLWYDQEKKTTLYCWKLWTNLEHFRYTNILNEAQNFTKLTASFTQNWRTSMTRNFRARIFVSKFLQNDQRTSNNYSDFITKGSIALIQQGRNDYAYDELYIARRNQNGSFTNQTGDLGGGFKNAPSTTSSLGLSNDFAMSINLDYDLFKIYRSIAAFAYGDAGLYRQGNDVKWETKNLYSAGLGLTIGKYLTVYLPLINHRDINNNYRDENLGFFERWSFQLNYTEKFTGRK
ncbi:MAG: hypothetical protein KBF57_13755 [Saprospiraceae bacterium]|nr:hypothetical protein [Saprospiraceae bacterium]